jgi:GR25 family glycosyltransferase involved in LPS biosynthesis
MKTVIVGLTLLLAAVVLLRTHHSFFSADEFESYLINLDKRKERLVNFSNQYESSDLGAKKPFRRVEAVDGSTLELMGTVTPEIEDGIKRIEKTGLRTSHPQMTRGMIGCYKSHYKVWDEIYASGKPYGLVFEDDAEMDPAIYKKTAERLEFPGEWDVILLGHVRLADYEKGPRPGLLRVRDFWGLHGYLISRRGVAKMMLYKNMPISLQIDIFMSKLATEGKLDVYAIDPPIVFQGNFGTDLQMRITPKALVNTGRSRVEDV